MPALDHQGRGLHLRHGWLRVLECGAQNEPFRDENRPCAHYVPAQKLRKTCRKRTGEDGYYDAAAIAQQATEVSLKHRMSGHFLMSDILKQCE